MNITETISLLDEPKGSIDLKRHHLAMAIRSILQREIAGEVWYESRMNDNKLQDCLSNAERELTDYVLQISTPDESITALRQAALDGERYRKAGEELVTAISKGECCHVTREYCECMQRRDRALAAYRRRTCEHIEGPCPSEICTSDLHSGHCTKCDVHMWTPPTYRQAVKQKEV